jgi:pimeloyl-[acyl-carrier protein] methyl ester esterase
VLLPGLDGTGLLFRPLLSALPADLDAKVVSYPAGQALGLPELATLVARQLPAERAVVLAESFSGLVMLTLLANASARIRAVIFVAAFAEPPRPFLLRLAPIAARSGVLMRSAPSFLLRQYCLGKEATAADLKMLREALAAVSPEVLGQRLGLVAARHSFGKVSIDVPSYYIRPSEDRLVPPACANWFQQRLAKCQLLEAVGPHFLLQARPRESAQLITQILRSLDAP